MNANDAIIKRCITSCMPYAERRIPIFIQSINSNEPLSYQAYTKQKTLYISIKNNTIPSNMVFKYSLVTQDCIVCYNQCNTILPCCKQHLCKECLHQLKHLSCPMCRTEIEPHETEYIIPLKIMKMLGFT